MEEEGRALTPVDVLGAPSVLLALIRRLHRLRLELRAEDVAAGVHGALQGVALPAEHVVAVLAVPGALTSQLRIQKSHCEGNSNALITHAEDERLGAVGGPLALVVELAGIPHNLKEELREFHGVAGRAGSTRLKGAADGIGDVALVVWAVKVDTVPASMSDGYVSRLSFVCGV